MRRTSSLLAAAVVILVISVTWAQERRRPDFERGPGQEKPLREVLDPMPPKPIGAIVFPDHPPEERPGIGKRTVDADFFAVVEEGQVAQLDQGGVLTVFIGDGAEKAGQFRVAEVHDGFIVLRSEQVEVRVRTEAITTICVYRNPEGGKLDRER